MCKTHSRAECGRLRQTTSSRKFASSARSVFCVIGNSIGFSYYTKNTQKCRIFPVSLCIAIHRFCFMLSLYHSLFQCNLCRCPSRFIVSKLCWRKASYSTIATELDRFRERISPIIGIRIHVSSLSTRISSGIPALSLPNII